MSGNGILSYSHTLCVCVCCFSFVLLHLKTKPYNNMENDMANTRKFTSFSIYAVLYERFIKFYAPLILIDSLPLLPILFNK